MVGEVDEGSPRVFLDQRPHATAGGAVRRTRAVEGCEFHPPSLITGPRQCFFDDLEEARSELVRLPVPAADDQDDLRPVSLVARKLTPDVADQRVVHAVLSPVLVPK